LMQNGGIPTIETKTRLTLIAYNTLQYIAFNILYYYTQL